MATIQLPVPSPLITAGDFTATVLDPGSGTPTTVIRTEDAWSVRTSWYLEGPIVALLNGRWRLRSPSSRSATRAPRWAPCACSSTTAPARCRASTPTSA